MLKNKIRLLVATLVITCSTVPAAAQYPSLGETKPLTIITLSGTGSQSDTAARYFAPLIEAELKQPVVVSNHPGGNGLIGIRKFYDTRNDCHTLLIGHSAIPYVSKFLPQQDMDPMKVLEPLHGLARATTMIIVAADSPLYSVQDMRKLYRANQRLTGASTVPMTAMSMALFDEAVGTNTTVVNYKNGTQSALDLAAGLVDYTFGLSGNASFQGLIDSKKLRVIGVLGERRSSYYPETATMKEQGYKTVEDYSWNGFFAHASDSVECKARLTGALYKIMRSPKGEAYSTLSGAPQLYPVNAGVLKANMLQEYRTMVSPVSQ